MHGLHRKHSHFNPQHSRSFHQKKSVSFEDTDSCLEEEMPFHSNCEERCSVRDYICSPYEKKIGLNCNKQHNTNFAEFKHACQLCPGDFSHTSCKYCLEEAKSNCCKEPSFNFCTKTHSNKRSVQEPYKANTCNICEEPSYCLVNDYSRYQLLKAGLGEQSDSYFYNETYANSRSFKPHKNNPCEFCIMNGEPSAVYNSHQLKSFRGKITCPILKESPCSSFETLNKPCLSEPYSRNRRPSFDCCSSSSDSSSDMTCCCLKRDVYSALDDNNYCKNKWGRNIDGCLNSSDYKANTCSTNLRENDCRNAHGYCLLNNDAIKHQIPCRRF